MTLKLYTRSSIIRISKIQIQFNSKKIIKLVFNIKKHFSIMIFSNILYCPIIGINLILIF